MLVPSVFWLWSAGLVFLATGLVTIRNKLFAPDAAWQYRWIAMGPLFVAGPLAVFAAEHFVDSAQLAQMVPVWMPARLFWVYFVGLGLLAAATSLIADRFIRWSATLLGVMFLLFVLMMHLPFAMSHPGERYGWIFVLRESAFAGGAWAYAGFGGRQSQAKQWNWMVVFGRIVIACAVIYFGVQQMLHPEFAPGVPDSKLTPVWVPLHSAWGYPVGASLLAAGVALLVNFRRSSAAILIAVVMTLLTVLLYLPIMFLARDAAPLTDAINFVADTLMFGGTALLLAGAESRLVAPVDDLNHRRSKPCCPLTTPE